MEDLKLLIGEDKMGEIVKQQKAACFGAGTNSVAMLIGLHERGERPDVILFADTGGEKPETYWIRDAVSDWCEKVGFPRVVTVKAPNKLLEQDCIDRNALPSIAYGFKTCSLRWKKEPQDKYLRNNGMTNAVRLIGIDAGEVHRAKEYSGTRYPLVEWDWGRDECVDAIRRAGLPQPGKSACFFCPNSRPNEILELKRNHPDLLKRALKIEAGAKLTTIKGLGRSWSWVELIKYDDAQLDMFRGNVEMPCECLDG